MNYIGCLIALVISLSLSRVKSIGIKEAQILTCLGWVIALYFAKKGAL